MSGDLPTTAELDQRMALLGTQLEKLVEIFGPMATRLECLRLAAQGALVDIPGGEVTGWIIDRARSYADFVLRTSDAGVIDAARDSAEKVA